MRTISLVWARRRGYITPTVIRPPFYKPLAATSATGESRLVSGSRVFRVQKRLSGSSWNFETAIL